MIYLKYLGYVLRHKWFVMMECFRYGLYWRGLIHDNSKLLPSEFIPYARHFYGWKRGINEGRDKTGYYKPTNTGDKEFDYAWFCHQKRNAHHWQWWILPEDTDGVVLIEIKHPYRLEMLCDWLGAGRAQGKKSPGSDRYSEVRQWWKVNNGKMQLHPNTREWINDKLGS